MGEFQFQVNYPFNGYWQRETIRGKPSKMLREAHFRQTFGFGSSSIDKQTARQMLKWLLTIGMVCNITARQHAEWCGKPVRFLDACLCGRPKCLQSDTLKTLHAKWYKTAWSAAPSQTQNLLSRNDSHCLVILVDMQYSLRYGLNFNFSVTESTLGRTIECKFILQAYTSAQWCSG